jgi:hypothetical protein
MTKTSATATQSLRSEVIRELEGRLLDGRTLARLEASTSGTHQEINAVLNDLVEEGLVCVDVHRFEGVRYFATR